MKPLFSSHAAGDVYLKHTHWNLNLSNLCTSVWLSDKTVNKSFFVVQGQPASSAAVMITKSGELTEKGRFDGQHMKSVCTYLVDRCLCVEMGQVE